jgi:hypothetical protein
MTYVKKPLPREPSEIRLDNLGFLREHDGKPERILKSRLIQSFERYDDVRRAYLVQIVSGGQLSVALCLKTEYGPIQSLVQEIGSIFAAIFVRQEHLDILFLKEVQELALKRVCAPFYVMSARSL